MKKSQATIRNRFIAITGITTCAVLMVLPDFSDAGWRRRARRGYSHGYNANCCQPCNDWGHHGGYSYQGSASYGQPYSHAQSGYTQTGNHYSSEKYAGQPMQSAGQPNKATVNEGQQITANRPINPESNQAPPAPQDSGDSQGRLQNPEQMRQRINNLEQENQRLREQLKEASSDSNQNTAAQEAGNADADIQANVESEDQPDLPAPPNAPDDSSSDPEVDATANSNQ